MLIFIDNYIDILQQAKAGSAQQQIAIIRTCIVLPNQRCQLYHFVRGNP